MTETTETPQLLKASEAAKALAISERSLWRLTAGGKVACVKIGRSVRYLPADLAAYVERHRLRADFAC